MYRAKSFGKNNISFYSMNKRRNVRVDYTTSVEIQELGIHAKPVFTASTKSLSIGGILLESQDHMEAGTKIQINMPLSQEQNLLLIGNVVRSEKTDSGSHEISVAFIDCSRIVKNEISTYLIKHLTDIPDHSAKITQPSF
jgi:c-di-GMP-binding flagellar brake protein YcgR